MIGTVGKAKARGLARILVGAALVFVGCSTDEPTADTAGTGGIDSVSDSATTGTTVAGTQGTTAPTTGVSSGTDGTDGTATTTGTDTAESQTDPSSSTSSGSAEDTTAGAGARLDFLEVTPGETILEVDLNMAASQAFIVTANFDDGSQIDVTDQATWTIDNAAVGNMVGPTLNIPAFANNFFQSAIVTASIDGDDGEAQITIAAYQISGAEPDFFFVLPFSDPGGNQDKPLTFNTEVKAMDVFINVDTTGSMGEEIANLQNALAVTIIPDIQTAVPNTRFGAGSFRDFPVDPFGNDGEQPFILMQAISNNAADVQAAVVSLDTLLGGGADFPESSVEALYQIATGEGLAGPQTTNVPANNAGIGGVEFREGSFPVVVTITDAFGHNSTVNTCSAGGADPYDEQYSGAVAAVAHSESEAIAALNAICARAVQIATSSGAECTAEGDGIKFAEATGAVIPPEAWDVAGRPPGCAAGQCCTGLAGIGVPANANGQCPMVYLASADDGTGVDTSFSDAVELLSAYGQFDVSSETSGGTVDEDGVALPAGTTTADFIKLVTPLSHGVVPLPGVANPTLTPTQFLDVIPDTDVTFSIEAYNDFIMPAVAPRIFIANIRIIADDCGDLDERDVFILVPPMELPDPG